MIDAPTAVAEVAIALAGFSGLIIALRRRLDRLENVEKFALLFLLLTSLGAALLALLPLALRMIPGASDVWLCVVSGLYIGGLSIWRLIQIMREDHGRFPWARRVVGFLQWVIVGVLAVAVAGYVERAAAYLMSLWWLVFAAAFQFFMQVKYMLSGSENGQDV